MASRLKHVSDLKQVNELLNLEYSSSMWYLMQHEGFSNDAGQ
jgi:hypothetical protein